MCHTSRKPVSGVRKCEGCVRNVSKSAVERAGKRDGVCAMVSMKFAVML